MKYKGMLTEGILLRRYLRFLADVSVKNQGRRTIYCPNLSPLTGCEVLGSRIWYRAPGRLAKGMLDVWELIEVDLGHLVNLNPENARLVVIEAVAEERISELAGFNFLQTNALFEPRPSIDLLLKQTGEQCFICIEPVIICDEQGVGIFPDSSGGSLLRLQELVALSEIGHKTLLFFCAQHNGITRIKLSPDTPIEYANLLQQALSSGVELLAYNTDINFNSITIDKRIPVLIAENIAH